VTETVLVTGGTGYVAGWQIVELLRRGYAVRTTVRSLAKAEGVRAAVASAVAPGDRLTFAVADLERDEDWPAAVAGCDYVLHVASPMGRGPSDPAAFIAAAREGALQVLRASAAAGVKRVVVTSSTAACAFPADGSDSCNDETVWTDPDDPALSTYRRSKVLAERAVWEFVAGYRGPMTVVTVLPTAIFGPVLTMEGLGSVQIIGRMLGGMPGNPRRGFSIVDVRDLAVAQVLAMTVPAAAGQRLIACGDFMWMAEIARVLKTRLGARGAKVSTRIVPDFLVRLMARRNPAMRELANGLGRKHAFNSAKAQALLGWTPRPAADTVVDCAESLIAGRAGQPA
jgi:nucleoside-diphosphate-sugar epimerase